MTHLLWWTVRDEIAQDAYRQARRRERIIRDRTNPLDTYNDLELFQRFRFDRQGIIALTNMLEFDLRPAANRNRPIPPAVQVLIALRFFGGGAFQLTTGDTAKISQPSVSRIIRRVSLAIAARLDELISYPTDPAEIQRIRSAFQDMAGFPGVLGCVDGTLIRIKAPSVNEWEYVGRKPGHFINVQAVALPDGSFSNVVVKYPGSAHDSRIFRESTLYTDLVAGQKQGLLLGDSAYALEPFLMKPLANPITNAEKRYQRAFCTTRAAVERAFGQLKARFNCLHQELRYTPDRCCAVIAACFGLHNFAIRHHIQPFPEEDDADDDDEPIFEDAVDGKVRQAQIIRRFFSQ